MVKKISGYISECKMFQPLPRSRVLFLFSQQISAEQFFVFFSWDSRRHHIVSRHSHTILLLADPHDYACTLCTYVPVYTLSISVYLFAYIRTPRFKYECTRRACG